MSNVPALMGIPVYAGTSGKALAFLLVLLEGALLQSVLQHFWASGAYTLPVQGKNRIRLKLLCGGFEFLISFFLTVNLVYLLHLINGCIQDSVYSSSVCMCEDGQVK